jgi:hypothetical protein
MIGQNVIVPVGVGSDVEGVVIQFDEDSGLLIMLDDEGDKYQGYEYQVICV